LANRSAALLVLAGVLSVQIGAAAATTLFDEVGPAGSVLYRLAFAAIVLWLVWRPRPSEASREDLRLAAMFGLALAAMNLSFYEALDRIPLGIAVTLEFVGPLGVAIAGSRRRLDLVWVGLAAAGIVMLAGPVGSPDPLGVMFALVAGAFWAAYILLSARVGRAFSGGRGLAIAMAIGAVVMLAPGIAAGGEELVEPPLLAVGFGVAMLSSLIPYSVELEALRRLAVGVFGVLMSLEPGVAALVGLVALGQGLSAAEAAGIALVTAAALGALRQPGVEAAPEA
jgi:inner membrane transporter RhtA